MQRVRTSDTTPERIVRSYLHRRGFRFRVHKDGLPFRPDVVLPRFGIVIFVHGCFWHQHKNCGKGTVPKTRTSWWKTKLEQNVRRDERARTQLRHLGWKVVTVWECQTTSGERLSRALKPVLETTR